jgi:hypothetical protein
MRHLHQLLPTKRHATISTSSGQAPLQPIKKLSVPLQRVNYYSFSPQPNTRGLQHCIITANLPTSGAAQLHYYRKYTRFLGEFIFSGLANLSSSALDISSPAQWIYFLWLVDLSSLAYWI